MRIATILLFTAAFAAGAAAQATAATSPDFFKNATHNGLSHQGASLANASTGFQSFHASLCVNYIPTSGSTYTFVYPAEGGYIFTDNGPNQVLLGAACAAGNLIGIYVTDSAGDFNQLYAYSTK